jgi:hypothetical protein
MNDFQAGSSRSRLFLCATDPKKEQISCIGTALGGVIMVENDRSREPATDD